MGECVFHSLTVAQIDDHEKRLRALESVFFRAVGAAGLASFIGAGSAVMVILKFVWG